MKKLANKKDFRLCVCKDVNESQPAKYAGINIPIHLLYSMPPYFATKILFYGGFFMKNEILEMLFFKYTDSNYSEFKNDKDFEQASAEFSQVLNTYIKDVGISDKLEELTSDIEYISGKHYFEAGFKYGLEIAKMFIDNQNL